MREIVANSSRKFRTILCKHPFSNAPIPRISDIRGRPLASSPANPLFEPLIEYLGSWWEFPNLAVLKLVVCSFYVEALFCALLRPFALFCTLLRTCVCALLLRKLERAVAVSRNFPGVPEENSGKVPRKLLENLCRIAKCHKFYDGGHGKGKPAENLGSTLPWTLSQPSVRGYFVKSTVTAFSSFSDLRSFALFCAHLRVSASNRV